MIKEEGGVGIGVLYHPDSISPIILVLKTTKITVQLDKSSVNRKAVFSLRVLSHSKVQ